VGRRSRARSKADGAPAPAKAAPRPKPAARPTRTPQSGSRSQLVGAARESRKAVAIYAGGAALLAVLVIAGIALLGGKLGPFVVAAYAILGAGLLHRWARAKLATLTLGDEDRMLQTVGGGLLLMAVFFAVLSAIVVTVVS
jgi:hypothetical protein